MKVAVVTESFLPQVNGVTNSVLRVLEHLQRRGHQAVVVAPGRGDPADYCGARVIRVPSVPMPGYPEVRVSLATTEHLRRLLVDERIDVVHLASPFVLGATAARAAESLGMPTVAIFQTDVAGFATRYGLTAAAGLAWKRLESIHQLASRTLAPSTDTVQQLVSRGVPRVSLWPRGVDAQRFSPYRRSPELRRQLAPEGQVLVGYAGRLAPEKSVADLAALVDLPGVRLVLIGGGPQRAQLEKALPAAAFLGFLSGDALAEAVASLDVFVHTGAHETFCQGAQEALASGVPVVAPAAGGLLDLVNPGHTGWLYSPGDLAGLRDHVRDLSGDAFKRRAFGEAARAAVLPRTWERVCDDLLDHYRAAVHGSHVVRVMRSA
jgi:phosphatidylinositol alpha 1,6-mannosyltransferase